MKTITHLSLMTEHKMKKPLNKLAPEVYEALPFKEMKINDVKEIKVKGSHLTMKMEKVETGCYFTISKNEKVVTENHFFFENDAKLQQIIGDIKVNVADFPILVTTFNVEGLLGAIGDMMMLADLEFCAAQIIYESSF